MTLIVGILLAAGSSSRFGAAKLLHPLSDGVAIGVAAAKALQQALPDSVAVVKQGDQQLITALTELGMTVVENPLADQGMSSSLIAGINASANADGWIIALADMPWIQSATIRGVAEHLQRGASIVAPAYKKRRGHPVGFSSHWQQSLLALSTDKGARDLIREHSDQLELFNTDDAGVLKDIDYLQDLND